MSDALQLSSLIQLPQPVLTVYLDTNPALSSNCRPTPGYMAWFKKESKPLLTNDGIHDQIRRVEGFLEEHRSEQRGLALFAGPNTWKEVPLQVEPVNQLHWGKPQLWQLFCIADQFAPSCIVALDRSGAHLFLYQYGNLSELETKGLEIDDSQWKQLEYARMASPGGRIPHGALRDNYEQRMDEQYLHFCAEVAGAITAFCKARSAKHIYLLGSDRLTKPVEGKLPHDLRDHVTRISHGTKEDGPVALKKFVEEQLAAHRTERKRQLVKDLLNSKKDTVLGPDHTLLQLQRGRLATLVLSQGFNPMLYQCTGCGLTMASSAWNCGHSQDLRPEITLHEVLPELLLKHACNLELVDGQADQSFAQAGAIGGWLRNSPDKTAAAGTAQANA